MKGSIGRRRVDITKYAKRNATILESKINDGDVYVGTKTTNVDSGESEGFLVCTGSKPVAVDTRSIEIDKSQVEVTLYEDIDDEFDEEAQIDIYNTNRAYDNDREKPLQLCKFQEIDVEEGTQINPYRIKAVEGVGGRTQPIERIPAFKLVLKPNTSYGLKIENVGNADIDFLQITWVFYVDGGD